MEPVRRPRVARETRLLLTVALLAVAALWALARLRFPDPPPNRQGVASILAPLVPPQGFSGLERQIADLSSRTSPGLEALAVTVGSGTAVTSPRYVAALRVHDGVAIALPGPGVTFAPGSVAAVASHDAVTGLAVLRLPSGPAAPSAPSWFLRDPGPPRYVMQTTASAAGTSLVPVLVGGLSPSDAPLWSGVAWVPGTSAGLVPGAILFTSEGEWIGLVVRHRGTPAIVPADVVSRLADRRLARADDSPRSLGVAVQPMTAALGDLLGFHTGVAVTWVAADGPAGGRLQVADVVHASDGQLLSTVEHWDRHLADLGTASTVLKVWRERQSIDVPLTPVAITAAEVPVAPARRVPGITARVAAGAGSEVTAVQPGSLAEAAGLRAGDVVTRIGSLTAPSPAQIRDALGATAGRPVLMAITRSGQHHLMVITP